MTGLTFPTGHLPTESIVHRCLPLRLLPDFSTCPECGTRTDYSAGDPMSDDEATSGRKHALFERFYEERCAKQLYDEIASL